MNGARSGHPTVLELRGSGMTWQFTKHALGRAVEMAVDAIELRRALDRPDRVYPCRDGRQVRQSGRIALVTEPGTVVTCLWRSEAGERWDRNDLTRSRDDT